MATAKKVPTTTAKKTSTKKIAPAKKASPAKKSAAKKQSNSASDAIDEQLARYRSMRDFDITAEPSGKSSASKSSGQQLPFVIQKHAASHLHYDFRLGWNGVLKSWAVTKGPSYFPGDRRLAVQVEDHPMEYGGFEGIIPAGQYGGGTVMLWDNGTWEPQPGHTDVDAGLRSGSLKFTMHGTKMKGNWTLVRMGGKAANEKKPNWLLIKEHDGFERGKDDPAITDEAPNSVVTDRTLDQIAANEDHVWNSKETANPKGSAWFRQDTKQPAAEAQKTAQAKPPKNFTPNLSKAPKEPLPKFIAPQLATQATTPPATSGWLHELKLDGYRIQAHLNKGKVELLTRTGLDWTHRMKTIAAQVAALPAESAILDGEVVVLSEDGTTSFADLQAAFQEGVKKPLTYFLFDILHLNGHNLRNLPLIDRKAILAGLLANPGEYVQLSEHLETSGEVMFRKACELHAEGIISKRADARYTSGRTSDWLKLKCIHEQEFVIGGFTLPAKGHAGLHAIGSLLLGYYDAAGKLIYAGRTGTGFTSKTHSIIRTQLEKIRQPANPFHNPPAEARRGAIWVTPKLVAQVNFATWTADNLVRQASFKGLREDKPAAEVRREEPNPQPRGVKHPAAKHASHATNPAIAAKAATKDALKSTAPANIRLTHPDKILDEESRLTKQQLADYYWAIAPHMLPHITGRPLSLVRCPEGSTQPCFFQKHVNAMLPPGIESVDVPDKKTGKLEPYITLSTAEALTGLAQMGVLEVHPWGSRNEDLEHPDHIIIDLDPDASIPWSTLADAASEVRKALKKLGLETFLKSTGGKGLHVVAPIQPEYAWPTVKDFAHAVVLQLEKAHPSLYLTKMSKAARKDRIYLDYLRNERGATAVAAFSPRARAGAPVSLPLSWNDLKLEDRPLFHVADYPAWKPRLSKDPWKQLPQTNQSLTPETLAQYKITDTK
ncbi:DNA ligase D [Granulicella sp. dw_53]|uniref:DNA ligase D n=1 Tax=Granulicella sp. dw_53 TaxID=2719792 RepID=UPI001BD1E8AA|nr:DNA ligase D [Granulicella sp. dw_53]